MAFKLEITARLLFLRVKDYSKRVQEHMEVCMRKSVRAAVKAAAGPEFPVQTGMAKATWRAVAQSTLAGKGIRTSVTITPTRPAGRPRRGFPLGKSIDAGIASTVIIFAQDRFKFTFRVNIGTLHYRKRFFTDAGPSVDRAQIAFRETMRFCYPRNFPKLRASIRTKII